MRDLIQTLSELKSCMEVSVTCVIGSEKQVIDGTYVWCDDHSMTLKMGDSKDGGEIKILIAAECIMFVGFTEPERSTKCNYECEESDGCDSL